MRQYLRERLSPYKVPSEIRFLAQLPAAPTGKILKSELKTLGPARPEMKLSPRFAHFVWPPTPYRGQHQRPGKAGSAVFPECSLPKPQGSSMALPALLKDQLSLPVIGSPLFIVSNPELVIAQCQAGIIGAFPALNARPAEELERWLDAHPERARRPPRDAPAREGRALCGQPDRAPLERPPGARPRGVCAPQGADRHHQPARAARRGAGDPQLRRPRLPRRDQRAPCREGARGRRRRADPRVRRRRRPCRHAEPVRAGLGSASLLRRAADPVGRDHEGRARARRAGDGRRPRVHGHTLHRDARGECARSVQADDRRLEREGCGLHEPVHRRARQLPARQHRSVGARPRRPAERRQEHDEVRLRRQQQVEGMARHLGCRAGRRQHRRGAAHGRTGCGA